MMKSVLFVCLGNICRSPACEGIARHFFGSQATFDSAGTSNFNNGDHPDYRSISICRKHGVDISTHRARQFKTADWSKFDLVVALDQSIYSSLKRGMPNNTKAQLALFDEENNGVEDPWYGDESNFVHMYDQIEKAMPSFLKKYNIIQ